MKHFQGNCRQRNCRPQAWGCCGIAATLLLMAFWLQGAPLSLQGSHMWLLQGNAPATPLSRPLGAYLLFIRDPRQAGFPTVQITRAIHYTVYPTS